MAGFNFLSGQQQQQLDQMRGQPQLLQNAGRPQPINGQAGGVMGGAPGAFQGQQVGTQPTHPTAASGLDWNSVAQWAQQQAGMGQPPPQMPGQYGVQTYQNAAQAHPASQPFNGPMGSPYNGTGMDQIRQGFANLRNNPQDSQAFYNHLQQMFAARGY